MDKYSNSVPQPTSGLPKTAQEPVNEVAVALLTGGGDRPYAFGLAAELISKGVDLDLIGSDDLDCPEFHDKEKVRFLNLRGDQSSDADVTRKAIRVLMYYAKLIRYAATAKPGIFHILWNNKFQTVDRTLLMLYYKLLGKKIALTVHNVNAGRRDSSDTFLNRFTLRVQYRLSDHIFVHTEQMKRELVREFGVQETDVSVIPFGINNSVPVTNLGVNDARQRLGLRESQKVILFFGNIAPYKGLEYLLEAFQHLATRDMDYQLVVAGCPKNCEEYWNTVQNAIHQHNQDGRILLRADYIPDEETEVYFKAADVLVLPYRYIYQSGVLFLGYSFGLPVIAADVGSLKDEIVWGETGFIFKPEDPADLARVIETYFASELFRSLDTRRDQIREYAMKQHSWDNVGHLTMEVYAELLRLPLPEKVSTTDPATAPLDAKDPG